MMMSLPAPCVSVSEFLTSIIAEIQKVQDLIENLPPFPKGEMQPSPLAKLQNKLEKYELSLRQKLDAIQQRYGM